MKQLSDYPAYENYYHFIASTKYRKNLFFDEAIRVRLKNIIAEIIENKEEIDLIDSTVTYNHIHVLLETDLLLSNVGQLLFDSSSGLLRKEFPILIKQVPKGLWGGKSWEAIRNLEHLNNCISYIQRHQPDNTKV